MVELELLGVRVEMPSNTPVMVLRELEGRRRNLSIFIGSPEATAIAFALEGVEMPRPLTHDLFQTVLDTLGAELVRVVITGLQGTTYLAELHLDDGGTEQRVSCRPSDAVALAVRAGCPVFGEEDLLDEAGYVEDDEDDDEVGAAEDSEEVVEEFRQFIDTVTPDDFAS